MQTKELHQQILGSSLCYARTSDLTMISTAKDIAIESSKSTRTTRNKMTTLLDYLVTNPNAVVAYRKSDVMLKTHSDGSYLSAINARRRAAGHFYFGNKNTDNADQTEPNQVSTCQECSVAKPVVASVAECEIAKLFINCKTAIVIRTTRP